MNFDVLLKFFEEMETTKPKNLSLYQYVCKACLIEGTNVQQAQILRSRLEGELPLEVRGVSIQKFLQALCVFAAKAVPEEVHVAAEFEELAAYIFEVVNEGSAQKLALPDNFLDSLFNRDSRESWGEGGQVIYYHNGNLCDIQGGQSQLTDSLQSGFIEFTSPAQYSELEYMAAREESAAQTNLFGGRKVTGIDFQKALHRLVEHNVLLRCNMIIGVRRSPKPLKTTEFPIHSQKIAIKFNSHGYGCGKFKPFLQSKVAALQEKTIPVYVVNLYA